MTRHSRRPAQRALALIQGEPWAITRESLAQIIEIAARENRSLEAIEAEQGRPLEHTYEATTLHGIATIRLTGPLFRYANLFTRFSGATSMELVAKDLTAALRDHSVRAILLAIDSPGGTVSGTSELGELIYAARGIKPIVAHIDGFGASAAYWLASAADRVTASDTSLVGSIGVIMAERLEDDAEVVEFVSTQSPKKRTNPVEEAGRAQRQAIVDALGDRFVEAVARHRGVTTDRVLADFGQGDVFVGAAAEDAGLIDEITTYEQVHAALVEETSAFQGFGSPRFGASALRGVAPLSTGRPSASTQESQMAGGKDSKGGEPTALTAEELAAQYPEHVAAIRTAARAEGEAEGRTAGRVEGATAERTRILAIEELSITGQEAVIAEAKADPAATPESVAVKLVRAQKNAPATPATATNGERHLARLAGDEAAAPVPAAQAAVEGADTVQQTVSTLVSFSSLRRPAADISTAGDRRLA